MPVSHKARTSDQYDLEARLEKLIHFHLLDIEENPQMYAAKDRLATIQYVGMFLNRKFGWGEPEAEGVGSAVRKYSGAFRVTKPEANAARARAAGTRSASVTRIAVNSDYVPEDDPDIFKPT